MNDIVVEALKRMFNGSLATNEIDSQCQIQDDPEDQSNYTWIMTHQCTYHTQVPQENPLGLSFKSHEGAEDLHCFI